jgi:ADP-ribose pyrophosphatase YjhB (NUDIX family)
MADIRAISIGLIRHPVSGGLLVDEVTEPRTGRLLHRPPGGGIEFGEPSGDAVVRELAEEYDLAVIVGRKRGVLENIFTYAGQPGHEIVIVYDAELVDPADAEFDRLPCRDSANVVATWRSQTFDEIPLYPDGLARWLD